MSDLYYLINRSDLYCLMCMSCLFYSFCFVHHLKESLLNLDQGFFVVTGYLNYGVFHDYSSAISLDIPVNNHHLVLDLKMR